MKLFDMLNKNKVNDDSDGKRIHVHVTKDNFNSTHADRGEEDAEHSSDTSTNTDENRDEHHNDAGSKSSFNVGDFLENVNSNSNTVGPPAANDGSSVTHVGSEENDNAVCASDEDTGTKLSDGYDAVEDDSESDGCNSDYENRDSSHYSSGHDSSSKKIKPSPEATSAQTFQQPIRPSEFLPEHLKQFVHHSHEDFFVSASFDPHLIAELMYEGFLPIAIPRRLIPKLHKQRCVIYPLAIHGPSVMNESSALSIPSSAIHISKNVKKRSKKFNFTINKSFDAVVKGCHDQHGIGWLYDPIVRAFRDIHLATYSKSNCTSNPHSTSPTRPRPSFMTRNQSSKCTYTNLNSKTNNASTYSVNLYSIEVWNAQTSELAAGELGYAVGTIYTSLTGFSVEKSAGSVQLASLGQFLYKEGFDMWDLGMKLDYKMNLGAREMNRVEFVEKVRELRVKSRRAGGDDGALELMQCNDETNCKIIITDE